MFFVFQLHHTGIKTRYYTNSFELQRLFQLHHTGIKTRYYTNSFELQRLFQLHHTGIKTRSMIPSGIVTAISIAPYRN